MDTISPEYREQNRQAHQAPGFGTSGHHYAGVASLIRSITGSATVLDYGCGKGTFAAAVDFPVIEYDPCIPGKDSPPAAADMVVCTDVLEHVEPDRLGAVLAHIAALARRAALIVVHTGPSRRTLPDGRNAHLIQQPAAWWREQVAAHMAISGTEESGPHAVFVCRPAGTMGQVFAVGVMGNGERHANMRHAATLGLPYLREQPAHDREAHICGYGPSLAATYRTIPEGADVFTCSGAHDFLVSRGTRPHTHIECDPRPHKATMITPVDGVRYLMASCCHPDTLAKATGLWHLLNSEDDLNVVREIDPGGFALESGSTVGLAAVCVAHTLGYRRMVVHGMDCSLAGGQRHAGPHSGKPQKVMRVAVGRRDGREFDTTAQMISAAREFSLLLHRLPDAAIEVRGDGLLTAMLIEAQRGQIQ